MDWLTINENGEVEFASEEIKLVPEVLRLLTLNYNKGPGDNEGRKKRRALTELKYLYLAYSPKSPYKDFSDTERIAEARIDCNLPVTWEESEELKAVIPKFFKGTKTKVARLLDTVNKFMDKFEAHLNSIDLNERNMSGGIVHTPKSVMETLERLPRLAETLQELENQARSGIIVKTSSKGDHEVGWMNKNNNQSVKKRIEEDEVSE